MACALSTPNDQTVPMLNDPTTYDSIHVYSSDLDSLACRPHAEPGPTMGSPRRNLRHYPIPLSDLPVPSAAWLALEGEGAVSVCVSGSSLHHLHHAERPRGE
jgi:hypothetical protein